MKSLVFGIHAYPSSRRALFMFIPTNSDDQISVNLRKKTKKIIKLNIFSPSSSFPSVSLPFGFFLLLFDFFLFLFLLNGTHMSIFLHFLVRLSPETNYFVPVSISFILNEYSLYTFYFSIFFLKSRFQVSL